MKAQKIIGLVAAGALAATLALVGCASGGSSSSASASASSASASSASASASAASASASSASAASDTYTLINDGKLTIVTCADYPPFENLENGEFVGLDIELAQAIADKLGLEAVFENINFDAIFTTVAGGAKADIGISGISVDPERAKTVDFTDSYYTDDQGIAVMKGGDVNSDNVESELNKSGVRIGVQSGTTGESYVQENFPEAEAVPYTNSTDCFAYMQSGQVDAVCTNLAVVTNMLENAYPDAEIVLTIATGEDYAIVVNQDNPLLTAAINQALAELATDGTIDRLIEKYM